MYCRLKVRKAPRSKFLHSSWVETVTHPYLERSRDHGHVFAAGMMMRGNLVPVWHPQTHGIGSGLHWIAFKDGQLSSGRQRIRGGTPVECIRCIRLYMITWFLCENSQDTSEQEQHCSSSPHRPPPKRFYCKATESDANFLGSGDLPFLGEKEESLWPASLRPAVSSLAMTDKKFTGGSLTLLCSSLGSFSSSSRNI